MVQNSEDCTPKYKLKVEEKKTFHIDYLNFQ